MQPKIPFYILLLLLELNARPGLAIQIANGEGLRHRLQRLQAPSGCNLGVEARVALVQHLFA